MRNSQKINPYYTAGESRCAVPSLLAVVRPTWNDVYLNYDILDNRVAF